MKIRIFYKHSDEENEATLELARKIKERGFEVEKINTESKEGAEIALVYEVFATPTFIIVTDDGSVVNSWPGTLPLEEDIIRFLTI